MPEGVKMAEGVWRKNLAVGEKMMVCRVWLDAGSVVPLHRHEHEQCTYVLRGSLRYRTGGRELMLAAGQALVVPSNVPHGVEALEETEVLDTFVPVRTEYLDQEAGAR